MTRLIVRGARLYGGESADIAAADGVIVEIGQIPAAPGDRVVDAEGAVVLPGLVDVHTHLREPGRTDTETVRSGSRAAARGGFTAVIAMPNTSPVVDNALVAEHVYDAGVRDGLVDVCPAGAVTQGLEGRILSDLAAMHRSRAGVRFFSDDGKCVWDAGLMRRALAYVASFGGVVAQHAQDPSLAGPQACCHEGPTSGPTGLPPWPASAEETIIARDVVLARETGARLHICHVSTAGSVEIVRWAKARGTRVTAEVTPHHLALTTDLLIDQDPVYKVNPPLRTHDDVTALRAALADGTIDVVGTDHAPHGAHDKDRCFPEAAFGMVGLEEALAVVCTTMVETGLMTWRDVARVMSETPAAIAGMPGHGRPLAVGEPANLTVVDPQAVWTVDADRSASLSRNNPWHGRTLTGRVVATVRRGRPTFLDGALCEDDPATAGQTGGVA